MERNRLRSLSLILFSATVLLLVSGCASTSHYLKIEKSLKADDNSKALEILEEEKNSYGDRNEALFCMDKGILLHLTGQYDESNKVLTRGEERIEELYTKSVTGEVGAMLTNDLTLPYEGEDFEKVMVNLLMALNYAGKGNTEDALVEIRKIDSKLHMFNSKYEDKKNLYDADAFARYLGGILYESNGDLNDAFISYRNAYEVFLAYKQHYGTGIPDSVVSDLLRTSEALNMTEEYNFYLDRHKGARWISHDELKEKGEVIVVIMQGFAPKKEEYVIKIEVPKHKNSDKVEDFTDRVYVKLAFPKFVPRPTDLKYSKINVLQTNQEFNAFMVEDITAIAKQNLEDRILRIYAKTVARVAAKVAMSETAKYQARRFSEQISPLGVVAVDLATMAYSEISEQADVRSWELLPAEIFLARIPLEPGNYDLKIDFHSQSGGIEGTKYIRDIKVEKGKKLFRTVRAF